MRNAALDICEKIKDVPEQLQVKPKNHREVIGLLPASGKATRLAPLPCSKELYPIGFRPVDEGRSFRPKVVCHYLLEKMRLANITKAFIIIREGKWDIPAYFGDGKMLDMHLGYLMMDLPFGVPYTLDQAHPFVRDAIVAFGFPDIIFQPDDAFVRLLSRQAEFNADIVLGLFPGDRPNKMDMVDLDADGRVLGIQIKPNRTHLRYTWIVAVWTSVFTRFMHEYLLASQRTNHMETAGSNIEKHDELFISDVIRAALHNKVPIDAVIFRDGNCLDIGTPEDMIKASNAKFRG